MTESARLLNRSDYALPMPDRTLSETLSIYRTADSAGRDDDCFTITPILVANGALSPAQTQMVEDLDEALENANPTSTELVLYRGCRPDELISGKPYLSFLSTSSELMEALRFCEGCLVRFEIPQGSKILKVTPDQNNVATLEPNEHLIPRGMRFRLEEWNLDGDEHFRVSLFNTPIISFLRAIPLSKG